VRRGKFSERSREEVVAFSRSSANRFSRQLREGNAVYTGLGTVTFPAGEGYGYNGLEARRCFTELLRRFRKQFGKQKGYSTAWFKEFHKSGAIHMHFYATAFIPKGYLSQTWYEIVGSGLQKHLNSGTNIKTIKSGKFGIIAYARKYAIKQSQKVIPEEFLNFGRFWGVSGDRSVSAVTLTLSDIKRLHRDWEQKLEVISTILEIGMQKGKVREVDVLLARKDMWGRDVFDKDIGCTIWEMSDVRDIHSVMELAVQLAQRDKREIHLGGWLCSSNNAAAIKAKNAAKNAFYRVIERHCDTLDRPFP